MMPQRRRMLMRVASAPAVTLMGVAHDTSSSSPTLTRLGAAIGLTATAGIGSTAQVSDFDNMPIYKDIKLCNLAANGTVNAYLGDAGFARDGTNGDVMVEIPAFWYKIVSGATEEWWIADGSSDGFAKHPAFARGTPYADLAKIYVSAYETSSGYISKTGVAPLVSITRATARTGSASKNTGWSQLDIASVMAVNLLMYIEYASLDLQTTIGTGRSSGSVVNTGYTDGMAGHTGRDADSICVKWRHIENWWGNVFSWVDGINVNAGEYYWCLIPENFADNTISNYTDAGYASPATVTGSYIKTMGLNTSWPWFRMPTAGGGSAASYYCDAIYITTVSWRTAALGGGYGEGTKDGPAMWWLYYSATQTASSIGSRLVHLPQAA